MKKKNKGFTLIELLVAMTIMAMLLAIASFSYQSARKSARDSRRKADLEQIRSALEMCRTDSGSYPVGTNDVIYDDIICSIEGEDQTYLEGTPKDPSTQDDYYYSGSVNIYTLCGFLESSEEEGVCNSADCGSDRTCNYKVTNP